MHTTLPDGLMDALLNPSGPLKPPELKRTALEKMHGASVYAESLLAVSISLACFVLLLCASVALFCSDVRGLLVGFARCVHANWRVSLVFLFPMSRLAWLRIEPRIREWGPAKLAAAPDPTGVGHTSLAVAGKEV